VNSGDEVAIEVEIISQAKDRLQDVVLDMEYPPEFSFRSASRLPSFGDTEWFFGLIEPEEHVNITIRGNVSGEELQEIIFQATTGLREDDRLAVLYGKGRAILTVARPFLDFSYIVNDAAIEAVEPNDFVDVKLRWKNNLSVAVDNVLLRITIGGEGFGETTVDVPNGFYRGTDRTAVWNASSYAPFAFLQPGQEGTVRFRFRVPASFSIRSPSDSNFVVRFDGTFEVLERPSGFENVDVSTSKSYEVKIITDVQLVRKALYYFSPLPGRGPLPPRVGQETVYTIVWSLVNSSNDVKNLKVVSSLPSYMIWKGVTEPSHENITFDAISGEILWDIDLLRQGTGLIRPSREVRFQMGIIPSSRDIGLNPILVGGVEASGQDAFAGVAVRATAPAQSTELRSDPQSIREEWKVVP